MRNLFFTLSLLASCLVLRSPSALTASTADSEPLDQAILQITGPESLTGFMQKEFRFQEDENLFHEEDHWQSPEEFWQKKSGDCEDYALFAQYVLKKLGYEVQVVSFYDEFGSGHTVALYQDHGAYNIIDKDQLLFYKTKTIEESVTQLYPEWMWGAIAEQRGSRGWLIQELHKF